MIILFILVGAVDTHRLPPFIYYLIFVGCIAHYIKIKIVQNDCFKENTKLILEMSGVA